MLRRDFLALAALGPWVPQPRPGVNAGLWLAKHERFVERARAGNVGVLFLGDSLTEFWQTTGEPLWRAEYAPLRAANFGAEGDRTQYLLWRIENGELDGIAPRVTVLMIGSNNLGVAKPADIARAIGVIVDTIRAKLPASALLLLGILPRDFDPAAEVRAKARAVNELIAAYDDGRMVRFLDMTERFLEPGGALPRELFPDGVHLSLAGYDRWRVTMRPLLQSLYGGTIPASDVRSAGT